MPKKLCPIVMVKNEEYCIGPVLSALQCFNDVVLWDTGSIDDTVSIAKRFGNVHVKECGEQSAEHLGALRTEMGKVAATLGYEWIILVDGDELYYPDEAAYLAKNFEPPEGKICIFTLLQSVEYDSGDYWLMDDKYSRLAIHPADLQYVGVYPFESPKEFADNSTFAYIQPVTQIVHGFHLHRLVRSRHDNNVMFRNKKRFLYSLQNVKLPRLQKIELPYPIPGQG